ncbi:MAG: hypothetical protein IIC61_10225, partial [Proteobacteria bacterium]|nr:hypothetical protein [Pseudomonadota bacterium]
AERSRSSSSFTGSMEMQSAYADLGVGTSEFVGYNLTEQESTIAAILVHPSTDSGRAESVDHATQGQQVEVVISQSPFYAEGGGQLGDRGTISGPNGVVSVEDTQSPVAGLIIQRGAVTQGEISVGDPVTARVEAARRLDEAKIQRHEGYAGQISGRGTFSIAGRGYRGAALGLVARMDLTSALLSA